MTVGLDKSGPSRNVSSQPRDDSPRLRGVDGQRWYDEGPYGDDSNRYGALDGGRYAQPDEFSPYADQPPTYNEQAPSAPVRRSRGPQQRRGKRSGLMIPDVAGYDGGYDDAGTTYEGAVFDAPDQGGYDGPDLDDDPVRLTALDRQELRERSRERGVPSGPPAPPPPAGPGTVFHAPTTAIHAPAIHAPAQVAPAATYRSRRPGVAVAAGARRCAGRADPDQGAAREPLRFHVGSDLRDHRGAVRDRRRADGDHRAVRPRDRSGDRGRSADAAGRGCGRRSRTCRSV